MAHVSESLLPKQPFSDIREFAKFEEKFAASDVLSAKLVSLKSLFFELVLISIFSVNLNTADRYK